MKIIYKIRIHPLFYLVTIISIITGHFNDFFIFLFIIVFHELGHIISAIYFKWKVKQINILPFGAITIFDEGITKSLKEEWIIAVMGSLFQIIIYIFVRNYENVSVLHYSLLLFNLLPISPLDGSKILNVFYNLFFPFKKSYYFTVITSMTLLLLLFSLFIVGRFNFIFLLVIFFLVVKLIEDIKNRKYVMNKFLYERYYYPKRYRKAKIIKGVDVSKMYKDCNHIFKVKNNCYTEHEILRKMFDFKVKL